MGNVRTEKKLLQKCSVESRFFEPSIFRTSRLFEPWHVSLGFASDKHNNFTPDFSTLDFLKLLEPILASQGRNLY